MSDVTPERWKHIEALLDRALELPTTERSKFLEQVCENDPELRAEVESLLAADEQGGGMLAIERNAPLLARTLESGDEASSVNVGPYRLLQKVGEGGMGEVWEAEQSEPIRRRVAIKIIKRGMDTRQVIARFEAERQALATMDHRNVAKVFDAGATARGRPYFAMEFVQGVPITDHCDRNRLRTPERLELFVQVCEGVQHAHQNAIIHRDLKPSNVLVSYRDDSTTPKIIDFGVAKATSQRLTEKTVLTEFGALIGTPEYMSPEQAEMTGQGVDTRTDVYSLGVLLYELLVGVLPFESRELRQAGFDEIRRKIRGDDPARPSTRLSTLKRDLSLDNAERRGMELSALRRHLAGDLDWITMKAMEKDRARRYGSPAELAEDIRRHLRHEPVTAGPPSVRYRMRKFVRRHRLGVATTLLIALALLTGAAVATTGLVRATRAERLAVAETETARQVSDFLKDLFELSGPDRARGTSITVRELLENGAEKIDTTLVDEPEVRAELMATMGEVYRKLGLYPQARPMLEQVLETRRGVLGEEHPSTLESRSALAHLLARQGQFDAAEPLFRTTLEAQERLLGSDDPATLETRSNMAELYDDDGRYAEAEPLFRQTLDTRRRLHGDGHPDTLDSLSSLAIVLGRQGRYEEAEPLFLQALDVRARLLDDDHPDTLASRSYLAGLYMVQGRYDESERQYRRTLQVQRRVLGDNHPDTLATRKNIGFLYIRQGRYEEAESLLRQTLESRIRKLGLEHQDTLQSQSSLALLYEKQGRYAEAEPLFLRTIETQARVLGEGHPNTLVSQSNLASLYLHIGRVEEAERLYRATLVVQRDKLGDRHTNTAKTIYNLACLESLHGDPDAAMAWLQQAIEAGYADPDELRQDPDLESLHGSAFDEIVELARRNSARQRAR